MMDDRFLGEITPAAEPLEPETPELPSAGPPSTLAGDLELEKHLIEVRDLLKPNERFWDVPGNLDKIIAVQEMLRTLNTDQFKQFFENLGKDAAEKLSKIFTRAAELGWRRSEVSVAKYNAHKAA